MWVTKNSQKLFWKRFLVLSFLLVAVSAQEITNFIACNTLSDGELETRIYFNNVTAKETLSKGFESDVRFRQLTDGKHFIQLIYVNETIDDCEYGHHHAQVKSFLKTFKHDLTKLISTSNITVDSLDNKPLPEEVSAWLNFSKLRDHCKKRHKDIRRNIKKLKEQNEHTRVSRWRRDVSNVLLIPETKWCGKGYSATKYTHLGGLSMTDKCCRKHDLGCPFYIPGFTTKYGFFNWRVNTIMHCNCDERFRTCLKVAGTSDANLVGKLFFNVVQTKCFVLKPKKVCVKHSWWGDNCEKYSYVKQAVLRDNLPY